MCHGTSIDNVLTLSSGVLHVVFFFGFVTSAKKNGFGGKNVAGFLPGEWR